MDVVQKISEVPADAGGRARPSASSIKSVDDPRHAAAGAGAVLDGNRRRSSRTTAPCSTPSPGAITIEFFPDKAPEHVRNFLRLAQAGVYDGTAFHRVVRGFVVQSGALNTRGPLTEKQQSSCTRCSRSSTTRST